MYRQGDLLIVHDQRTPGPDFKKRPDGIVERGEATGHAHRVEGGDVLVNRYGELRIVSGGEAKLTHEEHGTIQLPEGTYRVVRQREFLGEDSWDYVYD